MLFNAGLSYSTICVAGSALSSYLDCKDSAQFGEHKRVRQFIKGVFDKRPASYKSVSKKHSDQMARQVLNGADVDTAQFSAHSTRAASTSASAVQWRASGRCATSGQMELGVNIYPVSTERNQQ